MFHIKTTSLKRTRHLLRPLFVRFDEKYECSGNWWLANNPAKRIPGTLTYSPKTGVVLTCAGKLLNHALWSSPGEIPVLGEVGVGVPITVIGLFYRWEEYSPPVEKLYASGLVVGVHGSEEKTKVTWMSAGFDQLNPWSGPGPFDAGLHPEVDEGSPNKVKYIFQADHDYAECGRVEALKAKCNLSLSQQSRGMGYSTKISFERRLALTFDEPIALQDAIDFAHRLELLFTLLTGKPSFLTSLRVTVEGARKGDDTSVIQGNSWERRKEPFARAVMPSTFETLTCPLGEIVDKWYRSYERFAPVLNLPAASIYGAGTFPEDRFLAIAQAVEGYCRIKWPTPYLDEEQFEPLRKSLVELISKHGDDNFRAVATSRIGMLASLSFADRIRRMLKVEPWLVSLIKEEASDKEDSEIANIFASEVAKTRNKLTHVDANKPGKPIIISRSLIWKLRAILCASVLGQVGVPFSVMADNVKRFEISKGQSWW